MTPRQGVALALISAFIAVVILDLPTAQRWLDAGKDWLVNDFNLFFVGLASLCVPVALWIGLDPRFNVRLGADNETPAFGRLSWFAMLFSAGLASGMIYWATAEPLTHFQANPHLHGAAPLTYAAGVSAITLTVLHWGLHGWAFYVLAGLGIALACYRDQQPLALRSALWPLLGERTHGPLGITVDLIGVLGTVFGVATSVGLAVAGMNAALANLFGIDNSISVQLGIVALVVLLGLGSVLSGVSQGIRRLSVANLVLSLVLMIAVLLIAPTFDVLAMVLAVAGEYLLQSLPMAAWSASTAADLQWQGDWTVFYWGWWLAWTPFVGLFVARISRGRTVREFVLAVLLVPTVVVIVWMSIFGGAALQYELAGASGGSLLDVVNADYSVGTTALIEGMNVLVVPLTALIAVLLFSWLITSLDSATLVICHLLEGDAHRLPGASVSPGAWSKVLWSVLLGGVTAALMLIGGVGALQSASIVVGLPVGLVLILVIVALVRGLLTRHRV
ncbi:MAG: BCCT family transporter [Pseudomonadales bacterium]